MIIGNLTYKKLYAAGIADGAIQTTVQGYDVLNRLTSTSVVGDSYHVSYGYDPAGNISRVTDPADQTTYYFYDDLGAGPSDLPGNRNHPSTLTTRREIFFHAGTYLSRLISYAYDGLNRLTDINYPDATASGALSLRRLFCRQRPDAFGRLTR